MKAGVCTKAHFLQLDSERMSAELKANGVNPDAERGKPVPGRSSRSSLAANGGKPTGELCEGSVM